MKLYFQMLNLSHQREQIHLVILSQVIALFRILTEGDPRLLSLIQAKMATQATLHLLIRSASRY